MSVNIELPSENGLKLLAPQKNKQAILKPMNFIASKITEKRDERKVFKNAPLFVPEVRVLNLSWEPPRTTISTF